MCFENFETREYGLLKKIILKIKRLAPYFFADSCYSAAQRRAFLSSIINLLFRAIDRRDESLSPLYLEELRRSHPTLSGPRAYTHIQASVYENIYYTYIYTYTIKKTFN